MQIFKVILFFMTQTLQTQTKNLSVAGWVLPAIWDVCTSFNKLDQNSTEEWLWVCSPVIRACDNVAYYFIRVVSCSCASDVVRVSCVSPRRYSVALCCTCAVPVELCQCCVLCVVSQLCFVVWCHVSLCCNATL